MSQKQLVSKDILCDDKSSLKKQVSEMLIRLADATWGRNWPEGNKKYTIFNDGWTWRIESGYKRGIRQFFLARLNNNLNGLPTSFSIWHDEGKITITCITEPSLSSAIKRAYQVGPVSELCLETYDGL